MEFVDDVLVELFFFWCHFFPGASCVFVFAGDESPVGDVVVFDESCEFEV